LAAGCGKTHLDLEDISRKAVFDFAGSSKAQPAWLQNFKPEKAAAGLSRTAKQDRG
jgi:hypothetical protein